MHGCFDHGTPKGLAHVQSEHTVHTAQSKGWDRLDNGALLNAAEEAGFEFGAHNRPTDPLPAESESPPLALVVLTGSTRWSVVQQHADRIAVAVRSPAPGSYAEVEIPYESKARRSTRAAAIRFLFAVGPWALASDCTD